MRVKHNKLNFSSKDTNLFLGKLAHICTDYAYKLTGLKKDDARADDISEKLINTGWHLLCKSTDVSNVNKYGYKSVAFINQESRQVHIATAGTKGLWDVWDDIKFTFGFCPNKFHLVKDFVTTIITLIGEQNAQEYCFDTSGHSLGAIVSDFTINELASRNLTIGKSVTFENPGSNNIINTAYINNMFTGPLNMEEKNLIGRYEVYNTKPNLITKIPNFYINATNFQICDKVKLVIPNNNTSAQAQKIYNQAEVGSWGFGTYLYSKIGSAINTCSEYLGISNVIDTLNNHKLSNFDYHSLDSAICVESWNIKAPLRLADNTYNEKIKKQLQKLECSTGSDIEVSDLVYMDDGLIEIEDKMYAYSDITRAAELLNTENYSLGLTGDFTFHP